MTPLSFNCIHANCLAKPGEACGEYNIETRQMDAFVIDGQPAFHSERLEAAEGDGGNVTEAQVADVVEGWAGNNV